MSKFLSYFSSLAPAQDEEKINFSSIFLFASKRNAALRSVKDPEKTVIFKAAYEDTG